MSQYETQIKTFTALANDASKLSAVGTREELLNFLQEAGFSGLTRFNKEQLWERLEKYREDLRKSLSDARRAEKRDLQLRDEATSQDARVWREALAGYAEASHERAMGKLNDIMRAIAESTNMSQEVRWKAEDLHAYTVVVSETKSISEFLRNNVAQPKHTFDELVEALRQECDRQVDRVLTSHSYQHGYVEQAQFFGQQLFARWFTNFIKSIEFAREHGADVLDARRGLLPF